MSFQDMGHPDFWIEAGESSNVRLAHVVQILSPVGRQNDGLIRVAVFTAGRREIEVPQKHESPPGLGGLFSLYIQFSNFDGNSTPVWLRFFRFGMCRLEDFCAGGGLTRISGDQD
ncbi:hypothetical protein H7849_17530 [Alloacidobacterium dinghuense]|uniref:Uncharacterized protein n=1 Tax=Alloacidobacterium dinghuense TaxID=2763107 RepID=A0A7G8BED4_9BACT|nr:hypothetical protein [Alloacidobacterium dinghuense]QNI30904.1 hypothetical protein H7849_17530 [Alloacidobacterium dinghuense]